MTLDDTEDPAPLAPSSVPPMPIEHFESRAISTLPAPPPDAETSLVLLALEKLTKEVAALTKIVHETRNSQRNTEPIISALDVGITAAFSAANDAVKAAQDAANGVLELDGKLTGWRKEFDRNLGGRVVKIEDYLRKDGFGENDGSVATAATGGTGE